MRGKEPLVNSLARDKTKGTESLCSLQMVWVQLFMENQLCTFPPKMFCALLPSFCIYLRRVKNNSLPDTMINDLKCACIWKWILRTPGACGSVVG